MLSVTGSIALTAILYNFNKKSYPGKANTKTNFRVRVKQMHCSCYKYLVFYETFL